MTVEIEPEDTQARVRGNVIARSIVRFYNPAIHCLSTDVAVALRPVVHETARSCAIGEEYRHFYYVGEGVK